MIYEDKVEIDDEDDLLLKNKIGNDDILRKYYAFRKRILSRFHYD